MSHQFGGQGIVGNIQGAGQGTGLGVVKFDNFFVFFIPAVLRVSSLVDWFLKTVVSVQKELLRTASWAESPAVVPLICEPYVSGPWVISPALPSALA